MRTTIDLPDPLTRELKAEAARRGLTIKTVIRTAVETELRKSPNQVVRRIKFPLLSSEEPGALDLSNADIEDLLA